MYLMITGFPLPVIVLKWSRRILSEIPLRLFCSDLPSQMLDDLKFLIIRMANLTTQLDIPFLLLKLFTWLVLNSNYFYLLTIDI